MKLKYPLVDKVMSKKKLLTRDTCFKLPFNKCNSVEYKFDENDYYLNVPCFDISKSGEFSITHLNIGIFLDKKNFKLKKLGDTLYKYKDTSLYLIIKKKVIVCVFEIRSYGDTLLEFREGSKKYHLTATWFRGSYKFTINKKDLEIKCYK